MGAEPLEAGERERALLRSLAAGRIADLAATRPTDPADIVGLLARTDARARGLAADVPEVEAVLERVERDEPPGSRLRVWGQAMLAERLLLEPDGASSEVADQALDELNASGPAGRTRLPLALRYARARLRRVASLGWLFPPPSRARGAHRQLRDEAVAELLACNLVGEVHLTRGLDAGMTVVVADEEILENYTRLLDARAALDDDDAASVLPAMLDVFVGLVAFEVGDFEASLSAFERLEQLPGAHPRVRAAVAYGRAYFRLVTGGATPQSVRVMERVLAEVRRHDPRTAQTWHGQVANTLLDTASREAERFARFESELPASGEAQDLGRRLLGWRLATLSGGGHVPTDEALAALDRLEYIGFRRRAGRLALRLGHDLARGGDGQAAARLHAWGRQRMPRGRRLTIWERWWSRPVEGPSAWENVPFAPVTTPESRRAGTATHRRGDPGLEVHVMVPALSVRVDGEPAALSSVQAKLVLALAVAHPVPLHVERASDLLWPDDAIDATRYRLNSLVYRLRQALDPHGGAIVRRGDLLHLDPDRCDVDLWRLRRALVKGTPERVEALASVKGNLCEAQFPYDEQLIDERHRVRGELVGQARGALRAGEVSAAELEPLALALDLAPGELTG